MAFISWASSWRGKVPDMGVMMGDEMLMPWGAFFRRGEKTDRMDEARDCVFSSRFRLRLVGLFFSRRGVVGVWTAVAVVWAVVALICDGRRGCGLSGCGCPSVTPASLAASCSITSRYISSSCCCAICLSSATMLWSTDRSMPGACCDDERDGWM